MASTQSQLKMDIASDITDDDSVLDELCAHNAKETSQTTILDMLCARNETLTPTESVLEKLCQHNESDNDMLDQQQHLATDMADWVLKEDRDPYVMLNGATPEELREIEIEMNQDEGGWHNQEHCMAEMERRLVLKKKNTVAE